MTLNCCSMVYLVPTDGCDNPDNLNTMAIIDTGAYISLLNTNAPAERHQQQTPPKSIIQPKGPMLTTTENLVLLLNKLPTELRLAYRTPGIKNNLVAALELIDAGCELFFHQHSHTQRRNHPTRVARHKYKTLAFSLLPDGGQNINPQAASIKDMFKVPTALQALSLYKFSNTSELINFHHFHMAINQGYFQGWPGLSDRVRRFIKPLQACEQGHMDQRHAGICSTKSSHASDSDPAVDHMHDHKQPPNNDKTNMVFMTVVEVAWQLFTDQTGRLPVTSYHRNNYIVIFYAVDPNYIKADPIKS
ncbi:LOW QUALITY PROTEIN: hypothetical protein ACHAW6_001229 [Cyclotella cf. meneghiniana]